MANKPDIKKKWYLSNDQPIETCQEYQYLGIKLGPNAIFTKHIPSSLSKAGNKKNETLIWLNNTNPKKYNLTPEIKIRHLYEATIRPTTEYGAQILGPCKEAQRIENFQNRHQELTHRESL